MRLQPAGVYMRCLIKPKRGDRSSFFLRVCVCWPFRLWQTFVHLMLTLSNIREHTANSTSAPAHAHTGWGWVVALTAKTKASATKRYNDIQQEQKKTTASHHAGRKRMQFDHPQPPLSSFPVSPRWVGCALHPDTVTH